MLRLWAIVVCLLMLAGIVSAQEGGDIVIAEVWVRATVAGGEVSGAYMTITNQSDTGLALVGVSTGAAGLVEIHETQMDGGVMRMRPVEQIALPPGESASLEPGGFHVMLMDLTRGLSPGDAISLTLTFVPLDQPEGAPIEVIVGALAADVPPETGDIIISEAWSRPTASEQPAMGSMDMGAEATEAPSMHSMHGMGDSGVSGVSGVYFHVVNLGESDRLIGASTDAAGLVEIHETAMAGGVMRMQPIEGIDLPTGQEVVLEPGGLHVMLSDLQSPLVSGEALALTLNFESGQTLNLAVPIYDRLMMP